MLQYPEILFSLRYRECGHPLVCPKCSGKMKIIIVIDDEDIKKKEVLVNYASHTDSRKVAVKSITSLG